MSHPLVDQYLIQKYILFRNLSMAESFIMGIILDGHLTLWITYKINRKHNTKIYQKKMYRMDSVNTPTIQPK